MTASQAEWTPMLTEPFEGLVSGVMIRSGDEENGQVVALVLDGAEGTEQITVANARLIAAAPDLLEALNGCNDAFASWQVGQIPGRPEDILALIVQVRAAIDKAEGRS